MKHSAWLALVCFFVLCDASAAKISRDDASALPLLTDSSVKVMTLNMAHGRADGFSQILQSTKQIKQNLDAITELLNVENPAIVGLQEVDYSSVWNGRFNHAEYLVAGSTQADQYVGQHTDNALAHYGTGLLSQFSLLDSQSFSFQPNLIRPGKGFVLASIAWPHNPEIVVDLVSVHLDFLSSKNRFRQVAELIVQMQGRNHPLILMGDFNADVTDDSGLLHHLMTELGLSTWQARDHSLVTFPASGRRLDYILISDDFLILDHRIVADVVSDHLAVVANIVLKEAVSSVGK